jgi:transketolase
MEEFKTALRKFGSRFQGHPDRNFFPMLETSSGPLGSGLSQAVGMALAKKMDGRKEYVFCLMSDGELDEGNTWEAVMLAGKYKLGNLIAIIDRNQIQISGTTEDVMPLEPLADKWESFNWHAQEIGGHNFDEIVTAIKNAKFAIDKPSVIIAHTIPGKGVSFMENDYRWHGRAPAPKEAEKALKELS